MDSAPTPAIGTDADQARNLLGTTGAGFARRLYDRQIADLMAALTSLRAAPSLATERARAAALLHKIAGTAAYFDDQRLGEMASASERSLIDPPDDSHVVALCDRLLSFVEER